MGFFEDADIDLNEIPDDPYGFGKDFWPIYVVDVKDVKPTNNGQRFGMMVQWAVDHPKFQNSPVSKNLGYGNWVQLPVPKPLQGQIPWDPKSDEGQKCLFNLKTIFKALGFSADEMGKVGPEEMKGRRCLAKIRTEQNEAGFWQFNVYGFKELPDDANGSGSGPRDVDGLGEFSSNSTSNPANAEDLLDKELNDI